MNPSHTSPNVEIDLTELETIVEEMYDNIPRPYPAWMSSKEDYLNWLKQTVLPDAGLLTKQQVYPMMSSSTDEWERSNA